MTLRSVLCAAVLAPLLFAAAPHAQAQETPHQYSRCTAADRETPTLSRQVFPTATFEMVEDKNGTARGPNGPVQLWYKHGLEKVTLAPGVELELSLGGCNYHGGAYRFRIGKTDTPTSDAKFWINKAIELIDLVAKGNTDSLVDLPALKTSLQKRLADPEAKAFKDNAIDGKLLRGGNESAGTIETAYLMVVNQREEGTTVSISYLIGPI